MTSFYIIQTDDPADYEGQIFRFWDEYLPGTPHGRLEWMRQGNPAGPAIWLLALREGTGELIGTISIMPRHMFLNGEAVRAGIVGDLMVHEKHRVFGPGIQLPKAALERSASLGFGFLYTIPNAESEKVMYHAGFILVQNLCCYVKPIKLQKYLERYLTPCGAKLISPAAELTLKLISRESYLLAKGHFEETSDVGESFDIFSENLRKNSTIFLGNRNSSYLRWRYLQNPLYKFRILKYRSHGETRLSGYIIFYIHDDEMHLFDVVSLDLSGMGGMLKNVSQIARAEHCKAVYFMTSRTDPRLGTFKSLGFFDGRDNMQLFSSGNFQQALEDWKVMDGDRNI
jgi:hypothetical protein